MKINCREITLFRVASMGLLLAIAATGQTADIDKTLTLDAAGLTSLRIEAGAGFLHVQGVEGDRIEVVGTMNGDARDFKFTLEKHGDTAVLVSHTDGWNVLWLFGSSMGIDLTVKVPNRLALDINDGSGAIKVKDIKASVRIADGSGSMSIDDVVGNVDIHDGSGAIHVNNINGHVSIHDGSGGINVANVKKGLTIYESGSGGVTTSNIEGGLQTDR